MTARPGLVLRGALCGAGLVLFVVAARYAAVRSLDVRPGLWVRWLLTAAILHDVVVAPLVIVVGWLVVRYAPPPVKAPLQAGLILTAVLVAMAWPALRDYGSIPSNPTYLPRDYATGLAATLGLVWAACGAWAAGRLARSRSRRHAQ